MLSIKLKRLGLERRRIFFKRYWKNFFKRSVSSILCFLLLFTFFLTQFYSQKSQAASIPQWTAYDSGTNKSIENIFFINESVGWAVGNGGVVVRSTDGGESWMRLNTGVNVNLHGLYFKDANEGWVVGDNNTLLHTTDGGNSWALQDTGLPAGTNWQLQSICFPSSSIGYVSGGKNGGLQGFILKTTDGGQTWSAVLQNQEGFLFDVEMVSADEGWACLGGGSFNYVLYTTDGWASASHQSLPSNSWHGPIHFVNSQVGWISGDSDRLVKTVNGGVTWSVQNPGLSGPISNFFISENEGWAFGMWDGQPIRHTTDGGSTWETQSRPNNSGMNHPFFLNSSLGWVGCRDGTILKYSSGLPTRGSLQGVVYEDKNGNGQPDFGEGIANAMVQLDGNPSLRTLTNSDGIYSFENLKLGKHKIDVSAESYINFSETVNLSSELNTYNICLVSQLQLLMEELNSTYDFYDSWRLYNDNAPGPYPPRGYYTELENDDIWVEWYPFSVNLLAEEVGFDTNTWYESNVYINGRTYPEMEFDVVGELESIPGIDQSMVKDLKKFLEKYSFSLSSNGLRTNLRGNEPPIFWNATKKRAEVPMVFDARLEAPILPVSALEGDYYFARFYKVNSHNLEDDHSVGQLNLSAEKKPAPLEIGKDFQFKVYNSQIRLAAQAKFDPTLKAGLGVKFDPLTGLAGGKLEVPASVTAIATASVPVFGEIDIADIEAGLLGNPYLMSEVIFPTRDFAPGESVQSLFLDNSRYEDLDAFSPVIRIYLSPIEVYARAMISSLPPIEESFKLTPEFDEYFCVTKITVHSPVNIHVFDSEGNHVGVNSSGGVDLEIPQSSYETTGTEKTIVFPSNVSSFVVLLEGTGSGDYTLEINRLIRVKLPNGQEVFKGISYWVKDQPIELGERDLYQINFDKIESIVNEAANEGLNLDNAINRGLATVSRKRVNTSFQPTALFVENTKAGNGKQTTLTATLTSLDKPLAGQKVVFSIDGIIIGESFTDSQGKALLPYLVPDNLNLGNHLITASFEGSGNFASCKGTGIFEVVNVPPVVSLQLSNIIRGTVVVDGTVKDVNLSSVSLTIDGEKVTSAADYEWDTTAYADGLHVVKLKAVDIAGEEAEAALFCYVDNTSPRTTIFLSGTKGENNWHTSDVTVTLSATDDGGSGIKKIEYSLDNGASWQVYTQPFVISQEGTLTILAKSTDKAGNLEDPPASATFKIDKTPPVITINSPLSQDYAHDSTLAINFSVFDAGSGLASTTATLDGILVENGKEIDLLDYDLGEHTLTITTKDIAGNIATRAVTFNIIANIDSLIRTVSRFYEEGLIKKKCIRNKLLALLQVAKRAEERGHNKVAKILLRIFEFLVRMSSKHYIDSQAAQTLLNDARYVRESL